MASISEFSERLFQDIVSTADAYGTYTGEAFFHVVSEYVQESGDLEEAIPAEYNNQRGNRVDGYGGDPLDQDGVLSIILCDFEQPPTVSTLTASDMDAMFKRGRNFVTQARSESFLNSLEESSAAFGLADLISQRWKMVDKVRFILFSNRVLSQRVDGRKADEIDGKEATYNVWDLGRLFRFATEGDRPEEILVDLAKDFGGSVPALPAYFDDASYTGYLMVLPGETLAEIYDRWGTRLLEQNVRVFLQARGKVNKGIRTTLEHNPTMFFAYNNGLSATAEDVEIRQHKGMLEISALKNLQIVNGGQTTASIHSAYRKKLDLSNVFVQVKLSIVEPKDVTEVVPLISEFANTQNRVSAADFFSNHPFHVRIEQISRRVFAPSSDGSFTQSKWLYERARGQYEDARAGLSVAEQKKFDIEYPKRQRFTKTDLAKVEMAWLGFPHTVSTGAQKNFAEYARRIGTEWESGDTGFNEEYFRNAISRAIIFRSTEAMVSKQSWYQAGYRANIVAYTVAKLANDFGTRGKGLDLRPIWSAQAIPEYLSKSLEQVAKVVFDILTDPNRSITNVTEYAKRETVWTQVKEVRIDWPPEMDQLLIDRETRSDRDRGARKDQVMVNGIEAQKRVVSAGPAVWTSVLNWSAVNSRLSPKDADLLQLAVSIPARIPTDRQSQYLMALLKKLRDSGCPHGSEIFQ